MKLQVILRVDPNQLKKKRKHAFILFLIVTILFTYSNLHAYSYDYHLFASKEGYVWLDLMPRINQMSQHIWCWCLLQCDTKRLSRACANVLIRQSHRCSHTQKNSCRLSPTVSALAHIWNRYHKCMCCSKSSVEH